MTGCFFWFVSLVGGGGWSLHEKAQSLGKSRMSFFLFGFWCVCEKKRLSGADRSSKAPQARPSCGPGA
ncbi:hypothetical protein COCVIDRAFT_85967 [Bipolaris victoriae FI3]|uniref:Secreted protein n=1 Tax=Bipolaris victoriae (strain FI3) TaxID=930091 RepID=W7EYQ5_BIPV3|nr:hypothetical protein COCVIDRAFT_85967 [Bipolaris victoriae FI3]